MKQDHPMLYADIAGAFAIERAEALANTLPDMFAYRRTAGKTPWRLETRQHQVLCDLAPLAHRSPTNAWASLAGLGLVVGDLALNPLRQDRTREGSLVATRFTASLPTILADVASTSTSTTT